MTKDRTKRSGLAPVLLLVLLAALAIWFGINGDYVAAVGVTVVGIAGLAGYRCGIVAMLGSIAGMVGAYFYAPQFGQRLEPAISSWLGTTGLINRSLAVGTIGLMIVLAASLIASLLTDMMFRKNLGWVRWSGFLMGAAQGTFAVLLFLGGLLVLEPQNQTAARATRSPSGSWGDVKADVASTSTKATNESISSRAGFVVREVTNQTRTSRLAPFVVQYNPFTRLPQLSKFEEIQKTIQTLSREPQRVQAILRHPKVMRLRRDKRVDKAVRELQSDKAIAAVLKQDGPLDRSKIMAILNSPAVLRVLDQKDLVKEAHSILSEVDPQLGQKAGAFLKG